VTRSQLHLRAKSGKRDALVAELDRLEVFVAIRGQAGFLGAAVLVTEDDPVGVLVEGSWASAEHFERWRESSARDEVLRGLEPLLAAEPELRVYHVVDAVA